MNTLEMSNEFDVLYNNIMSNLAPGIDEYEKSLFLTKALEELLKSYFDPRGNKYMQGFDGSEIRQIDFSSIIRNTELNYILNPVSKFDLRSKVYEFPSDCFIVVNEQIFDVVDNTSGSSNNSSQVYPPIKQDILHGSLYRVLPITYEEYSVLTSKPYKYPPKHVVWRIITSYENSLPYCEIIGRYERVYNDNEAPIYKMRYIKKPRPIILVDLSTDFNGLTIDGEYNVSSCELPEALHHAIVQRAVELAAATYDPQKVNVLTGIGNVSSTNLGVIPQSNKD